MFHWKPKMHASLVSVKHYAPLRDKKKSLNKSCVYRASQQFDHESKLNYDIT